MAKRNFLAIAVFFASLILIANAAEENTNTSQSRNTTNEASLNHSNNSNTTLANNTYDLNNTDAAVSNQSNKPIEINNSAENTAQDSLNTILNTINETKISNNTNYLNGTPETNNTDLSNASLSDALTAGNANIGAEEIQNNGNEIAAESSEALNPSTSSSVAGHDEESATTLTAGFGVYLEIVG